MKKWTVTCGRVFVPVLLGIILLGINLRATSFNSQGIISDREFSFAEKQRLPWIVCGMRPFLSSGVFKEIDQIFYILKENITRFSLAVSQCNLQGNRIVGEYLEFPIEGS